MSAFKSVFIACCLILLLQAASAFRTHSKHLDLVHGGKQSTFNGQFIDHFNPLDGRTWAQRYWVDNTFYSPGSNSPIFLYICGESTCKGTPSTGSYVYQMAQKTGALLVALEHRYYGLSQPFGPQSMKTENLRYLTVENALEDLAYFILWFKDNYTYKITESQPWITVGGSYPGALSAWFRNKYPHMTVGAWASSGVVNSILDYTEYDYQIYLSVAKSGEACPQTIQNLTQYFEYQLYNTSTDVAQALKAKFGDNAVKLSNDEMLWFIADSFVSFVQYGKQVELCSFLTNFTDFDSLVKAAIPYLAASNDVRGYGTYFISNDTFDADMEDKIIRQWTYQVCAQLGWFQTYSNKTPYMMRSKRINLDFFRTYCKNAYGVALWPNTDRFNNDFGGADLRTTNVILSNGGEDPWRWATKYTTTGSMTSIIIDCVGCGHCVDFHGANSTDPQELQQAHAQIQGLLLGYLGRSQTESITL